MKLSEFERLHYNEAGPHFDLIASEHPSSSILARSSPSQKPGYEASSGIARTRVTWAPQFQTPTPGCITVFCDSASS